jgi:hypothetical protein
LNVEFEDECVGDVIDNVEISSRDTRVSKEVGGSSIDQNVMLKDSTWITLRSHSKKNFLKLIFQF